MKKLQHLKAILAIITLIYLLGSFLAMDLNPKHWDVIGRITVVLLFVVVIVSYVNSQFD